MSNSNFYVQLRLIFMGITGTTTIYSFQTPHLAKWHKREKFYDLLVHAASATIYLSILNGLLYDSVLVGDNYSNYFIFLSVTVFPIHSRSSFRVVGIKLQSKFSFA